MKQKGKKQTAKMVDTKVLQTVLYKIPHLTLNALSLFPGIILHLYFLQKPQMVPYNTLRSRKHLKLLLVSFTKSPVKHGVTTFFSHHLTRSLTTWHIKSSGNLFIAFWFFLWFFTSEVSNMHLYLIDPTEKGYNFQIIRAPTMIALGTDLPDYLWYWGIIKDRGAGEHRERWVRGN